MNSGSLHIEFLNNPLLSQDFIQAAPKTTFFIKIRSNLRRLLKLKPKLKPRQATGIEQAPGAAKDEKKGKKKKKKTTKQHAAN